LKEAKLGKHIFFRESDIEDFINRMFGTQEVTPCKRKDQNYQQDSAGEAIRFISTPKLMANP
tara:strand:+ start:383 stop:568 length:186 start_codon:yes stop_codon:yes gene_type:complete